MQTNEISFVVQGAIDHSISRLTGEAMTKSCLSSLRKHHPGAELILSTWPDQDLRGLDYDVLVINEDPGAWNAFHPDCGEVKLDNTNRQIVSTKNGLRAANRKYAAKIRTDMVFTGNNWMRYFDRYPRRIEEWKIFQHRVITCSMFARDPLCPYSRQALHPPDWTYFGLKEDVMLLWDIEPEPEPEYSQWFLNRPLPPPYNLCPDIRRFSPEQYIWRTLMLKFGQVTLESRGDISEENIRATEVSFANNLIILDVEQFPFRVQRYPVRARNWYSFYRFLSHNEWEWLYHTYCDRMRPRVVFERIADPHYYLKRAYVNLFGPWQNLKKHWGWPSAFVEPVRPVRAKQRA